MADVHDALYRSPSHSAADLCLAMQSIADRLSDVHDAAGRGISLTVHQGELLLPLDFAIPCCLAINELVANALVHAFPEDWPGPRTVDLSVDVAEDGRVVIRVADSGIGIPPGAALPGEDDIGGLQLVRLLAEQLDGTLDVSATEGSTFELSFALP
jgi:two-component sensor histidine kinase